MKIALNKRNGVLAVIGLVMLVVIVAAVCMPGRGGNDPDVTVPTENIVDTTETTDNAGDTANVDGKVDVTEASEPSVEDITVHPVETTPSEPEKTEPEETKPSDGEDNPEETLVTMYATKKVNYRKGPGTNYEKVGSLSKGESVLVVKGSKTDNGWYKVVIGGDYNYVSASYLSSTKPVEEKPKETRPSPEPTESEVAEPEETKPSTKPTEPKNEPEETKPSSGNNSNGKTIYTYPDGTTGTEPREGATYVDERGVTRVWHETPESSMTEEEKEDAEDGIFYCHHCGRVSGDGSNGTCLRWSSEGTYTCGRCGATVAGGECHTCG